jgi:hypothetical protein
MFVRLLEILGSLGWKSSCGGRLKRNGCGLDLHAPRLYDRIDGSLIDFGSQAQVQVFII